MCRPGYNADHAEPGLIRNLSPVFNILMPSSVAVVVAEPAMFATPGMPEEEALVVRAVSQRKAEFRAGRHAFRRAAQALGAAPAALLSGKQREPLWPPGLIGSITHTGQYCAVALAHGRDWTGIAIDSEDRLPLSPELLEIVCRPEERERLGDYRSGGLESACRLIFSAKECIHKVYFPLNRYTLEFTDARVELDVARSTFSATIVNSPTGIDVPIRQMYGRFAMDENRLYTSIVTTRIVEGIAEC